MWIDTNHKMIYTYPVKCFSCRNGSEERIDNRVKFPNGTAAVSAEAAHGTQVRHWETGKAVCMAVGGVSQKTCLTIYSARIRHQRV